MCSVTACFHENASGNARLNLGSGTIIGGKPRAIEHKVLSEIDRARGLAGAGEEFRVDEREVFVAITEQSSRIESMNWRHLGYRHHEITEITQATERAGGESLWENPLCDLGDLGDLGGKAPYFRPLCLVARTWFIGTTSSL